MIIRGKISLIIKLLLILIDTDVIYYHLLLFLMLIGNLNNFTLCNVNYLF